MSITDENSNLSISQVMNAGSQLRLDNGIAKVEKMYFGYFNDD